jgi:hypothetical protein
MSHVAASASAVESNKSSRPSSFLTNCTTLGGSNLFGTQPSGQTYGRTFGERIEEHNFAGGSQEDRAHIEVYVGRLKGFTATPSPEDWRNEINWAEKLLIYVHGPAYNPEHMTEVDEADPRVCRARVFNWGCIRALRPEVSGRRWTKAATDEANAYKVYEEP